MKIISSQSLLFLVDIQEKLLPAINLHEKVLETAIWSMNLARCIGVPVMASEHFPEKIGLTATVLRKEIDENSIISKTYFSAVAEGNLLTKIEKERNQIIILGIEAHICVLQTVLDLIDKGFQVFVLESGVGSRDASDKQLALERMRQNGAEIISKEMLVFEWMQKAGTDLFKEVLRTYIK